MIVFADIGQVRSSWWQRFPNTLTRSFVRGFRGKRAPLLGTSETSIDRSLTNWGGSMCSSLEWRLGPVPSRYLNRRKTAAWWKIGIASTCRKSKELPCSCIPGCGTWRGGSLGLSGFQLSSRLSERPCDKGIRQRVPEQDRWHLVSI